MFGITDILSNIMNDDSCSGVTFGSSFAALVAKRTLPSCRSFIFGSPLVLRKPYSLELSESPQQQLPIALDP